MLQVGHFPWLSPGRSAPQRPRSLRSAEQAFKELKGDLASRPIYHQTDERIEAHILVAFVAYCLQVTAKLHLTNPPPRFSVAA